MTCSQILVRLQKDLCQRHLVVPQFCRSKFSTWLLFDAVSHALYASSVASRECKVVPANCATAEPPCPSKTHINAFPSESTSSFVTVEPAGCAGILGDGDEVKDVLALPEVGGRYRWTEWESSMARKVDESVHKDGLRHGAKLTDTPSLHVRQSHPVLSSSDYGGRVLFRHCEVKQIICIHGKEQTVGRVRGERMAFRSIDRGKTQSVSRAGYRVEESLTWLR